MMLQEQSGPPAAAERQDVRLERSILSSQLQELESSRRGLMSQLQKPNISADDRAALSNQLADVNQRIATVDNMLARAQAQVTGAPAPQAVTAGTTLPPEPIFINKSSNETMFWGSMFTILVLFLPISITLARRAWRRTPPASAALPAILDERLARMEQTIEATAIEVERIGEGQRFVTRLLTESHHREPLPAIEKALPDA